MEDCLSKVAFINRKLRERLSRLETLECVKDIRVIGGVGVVELNIEAGYLANIGQVLLKKFLEENILLRPLGNILYFMPPYVINEAEIDWVIDKVRGKF